MLTELLNSIFMERLSLVPLTSTSVEDSLHLYALCGDGSCRGDCAGGCEGSARGDYGTPCGDGSCRGDCVGGCEGTAAGHRW